MAMEIGIDVSPCGSDAWSATIPQRELRRLGRPAMSQGSRTIVGLLSSELRDGRLFFNPTDVVVLNAGASDDAVIVNLNGVESTAAKSAEKDADVIVDGDEGFRAACNALLAPDVAVVALDLLDQIRSIFPGSLVAGEGRKWVNSPANFVALTIQNRDQSIAVTVRGEPDKHVDTPLKLKLETPPDLKRDRPGYSRFKVRNPQDVTRAMFVIRRAAHLYNAGKSRDPLTRVSKER